MSSNEEHTLVITDIAYGGDALGRLERGVVFVPYAIPGETVRVRIVEQKKKYARASLLEVLEPSPHRIAPACPLFTSCGGCQYQHMAYEKQCTCKAKQLYDVLNRLGTCTLDAQPIFIPSPASYHYRNTLMLHGPGKPGLMAGNSHMVVPVRQCPVAVDSINDRLPSLGEISLREREHVVLRADTKGRLYECLSSHAAGRDEDVFFDVSGLSFSVKTRAFFQANTGVLERILQHVGAFLEKWPVSRLIDAYCGVGVFAISLSHLVQRYDGIEGVKSAVSSARKNAEAAGRTNGRFIQQSVETALPAVLKSADAVHTALLLDPPRTGCSERVLNAVCEHRPAFIVYISCMPPMLARDLKTLSSAGYELLDVRGYDMFPQTAHFETCALLQLNY